MGKNLEMLQKFLSPVCFLNLITSHTFNIEFFLNFLFTSMASGKK